MNGSRDATERDDLDALVDRAVDGDTVAIERLHRPHPSRRRSVLPYSAGRRGTARSRPPTTSLRRCAWRCYTASAHLPAGGHARSSPSSTGSAAHKVADAHRMASRSPLAARGRGAGRAEHGPWTRAVRGRRRRVVLDERAARPAPGHPTGDSAAPRRRGLVRRRNRSGAGDDRRRRSRRPAPRHWPSCATCWLLMRRCRSSWSDGQDRARTHTSRSARRSRRPRGRRRRRTRRRRAHRPTAERADGAASAHQRARRRRRRAAGALRRLAKRTVVPADPGAASAADLAAGDGGRPTCPASIAARHAGHWRGGRGLADGLRDGGLSRRAGRATRYGWSRA